jgi:hypothetical protein
MKTYRRVIAYAPFKASSGALYDWCQSRDPNMLKLFETLVAKLMLFRWHHAELLDEMKVCCGGLRRTLLVLKAKLIFARGVLVFWNLSTRYLKTDFLPEELEAYTYIGVRILRIPLLHKLGTRIHACTKAPSYEFYRIKELEDNWIFRELFSLRWAILHYYYAKREWKGSWYEQRNIPFYKTISLGESRRSYRRDAQRRLRMIRRRFPEQLQSKWFPVFISELVYLLEFENKMRTAAVYRKLLV